MEKTLIIFKPDCLKKNLLGKVINRLQNISFQIIACKMMKLNDILLDKHYSHIVDKDFYPDVKNFMKSNTVIVMVLEGKDIINQIRNILGPTDSLIAKKGTIRGDWGLNKMENIAHASDSKENAIVEINIFFDKNEIF